MRPAGDDRFRNHVMPPLRHTLQVDDMVPDFSIASAEGDRTPTESSANLAPAGGALGGHMGARATVMSTAVSMAAVMAMISGCGSEGATSTTSPLQALFGGQESPAESRAKQLAAEEIAAACMKDLGW